jgi:hypothetical protein
MRDAQARIDALILPASRDKQIYAKIDQSVAFEILDASAASFDIADDTFEWEAMRGLLKYFTSVENGKRREVLLLAETGRRLSREKSGDKSGLSILGTALRQKVVDPARSSPALVLLQQVGTKELGWSGHPFWWPVLAAPATGEPCIFAAKVAD